MKSADIRSAFLSYFAENGHTIVPSSSLVPGNDPTLLFTNAGMVQFKDVFLGDEPRHYSRATTSQRCVRAGGKHNDLENVGYTARHHTFFEMLGNFSFGDYFKRDAIRFAWGFLTECLGLPAERLWVTVHTSDQEAEDIWIREMGIDPTRFSRLGDKDNFWTMGDTGPCGPCSEIFYDHGPQVAGGPPGSPDDDLDRYIEIWNLVFMQYEQAADGTRSPLPRPSVDTGMGLERIAAVMQGVHSNYEIDLFRALLSAAMNVTGTTDTASKSLRVIADHIRSCAFLICDGVLPSNEGRGYVLRRIVRRAIRHGHKLGCEKPFFHRLVHALVAEMGEAYPELRDAEDRIVAALKQEEAQFAKTLDQGMRVLDEAVSELADRTLPGALIFKLYDTHGFPVDLTNDIARERDLIMDMPGFEAAMAEQRAKSRQASQFSADGQVRLDLEGATEFLGYTHLESGAQVLALVREGQQVEHLEAGQQGIVILNQTPFYAESGGQQGDSGQLTSGSGAFLVETTQKLGSHFAHEGRLQMGHLAVGDTLTARVEGPRRHATALNHSATHLLHAALRQVLGTHVTQKGSLVTHDRTRFDFSHQGPVTSAEIAAIEALVNGEIRKNVEVRTQVMAIEDAKAAGAMALFGEKYADEVRVLTMGSFSIELCGGTHVSRTGDIGLFKVVSEGGVASGVRRIEAVTGEGALDHLAEMENWLREAAVRLKATPESLLSKVDQTLEKLKGQERELEQLRMKVATQAGGDLLDHAIDVCGVRLLSTTLEGADPKTLRDTLDRIKQRLGTGVIVLATVRDDKVNLIAGVTDDLTAQVKAGDLIGFVASQVGGKGGGRADMAQAGGTNPASLPAALASVQQWLTEQLA
ncbi:MAG: alanine--tRNA ligase [Litorivicinaceae bacterium]|nr:alanine--tRNA ligase [Litorivicinaceae bacterium]MDP5329181.1 alanine--tRNA ligase [Litorivicinaceae bacterium]MDP5331183.1 alanine--tRNA ligase [Litorivicinaceae bacterium]MDP5342475.1 alanine--tRNA ligase [Litorivicinaceae bacterium]MDP5343913.1 alanine--tRNA ligase [Litorivicinaceae bacterium]